MLADQRPITSVRDLLAPHDAEFIRAAYEAVLGRAPDAEGGAYYLARLRSGIHKLEIIKQLRRSPEGRKFIPGVAGLDRAIRRHRWATLPFIGVLVRLLSDREGNSATHRQLRILANDVGRMHDEQSVMAALVQQLGQRPMITPETVPPTWGVPAAALQPPRLDPGPMPETFDSAERRALRGLRLFALTRGAPA